MPQEKIKLKPRAGQWWQLVDPQHKLWVPIGSVEKTPLIDLAGMVTIANYYYLAGILGKLCDTGWIGDLDGPGHGVVIETGEVIEYTPYSEPIPQVPSS